MCMGVLSACVSVHHRGQNGTSDSLSLELQTAARHHMGGYWELNHCPLEKQPGLLIAHKLIFI